MATGDTSGTEHLGLQELGSGVGGPTQGAGASGGQVPAQESGASQNPFANMSPEQIEQEIARRAQSMKDKELHRIQMEAEQRAALEAQQREWAELDDEEYGRRMRQLQQEQAQTSEKVRTALMGAFVQMRDDALSIVQNEATRGAIRAKSDSGQFQTFTELQAAIIEAATQERLARERSTLEKQIRGAAVREATADTIIPPILGSGIPTQSGIDVSKLDSTQKIALGWAQKLEAQRRSRGG